MKLWVCSFPGAEHPHLGYSTEHKAVFRVSCDQSSSGEVKHPAAVSAFETEKHKESRREPGLSCSEGGKMTFALYVLLFDYCAFCSPVSGPGPTHLPREN